MFAARGVATRQNAVQAVCSCAAQPFKALPCEGPFRPLTLALQDLEVASLPAPTESAAQTVRGPPLHPDRFAHVVPTATFESLGNDYDYNAAQLQPLGGGGGPGSAAAACHGTWPAGYACPPGTPIIGYASCWTSSVKKAPPPRLAPWTIDI